MIDSNYPYPDRDKMPAKNALFDLLSRLGPASAEVAPEVVALVERMIDERVVALHLIVEKSK